jgi:hypothetical protein
MAFTFAGASAPILAADLDSQREAYPDDDPYSENRGLSERELAELCYSQRNICRKICNLRSNFNDNFDGCPDSCESRAIRCMRTACYRWSEPEYLIAEKFGGYRCPSRSSLGLAEGLLK